MIGRVMIIVCLGAWSTIDIPDDAVTIDANAASVDAVVDISDPGGDVLSVAIAAHVSSVERDPDMPWLLWSRKLGGDGTPKSRRRVVVGAYFAFVIIRTAVVLLQLLDVGNEIDGAAAEIAGIADAALSDAAESFEGEMHMI